MHATITTSEEARTLSRRGIARGQQGEFPAAIDSFNRAIAVSPEYAEAYNNRGVMRQRLGDVSGAIADFSRAIELAPAYLDAFNNRGTARQAAGDLEGALADFDRALEQPDSVSAAGAYHNRGTAYRQLGDDSAALADFNQALTLNPQLAVSYQARGVVRHRLGQLDEALADFARALELTPKAQAAPVYNARGGVKVMQGDLKAALDDYNRALEIDPRYYFAYISRANVRYHLRDLGGYVDYRRAFAINPEGAAREVVRILVEDVARDADSVLANCRKHLRINPNDITALARRGLTLLLLGREDDAQWECDEILAYRPELKEHLDLVIGAAREHIQTNTCGGNPQ